MHYRNMPNFLWRRVDRIAAEINSFLIVIAIGLVMLNLLCLTERLVDNMPVTAQYAVP